MIVSFTLIGVILFFRQNPDIVEKARDLVSKTETEVIKKVDPSLLLPDMMIISPKQLYISHAGTKKSLRFNTTFINKGVGPLEVIGHHDLEQNKTYATQYIKKTTGGGEFRNIGEFVYHPDHDHWHVDNYVQYQLWSVKNGNEKDAMVASTGKQSFCVWDEHTYDLTLTGAPQKRFYTSACSRNTQGMSVGWGDTYLAKVEGQVIDVTSLPDGEYILWFEVNPNKKIQESNYLNNADWIKIAITGNKLTNLGK